MKIMCAFSLALRLVALAFATGVVVGVVLGYRAADQPAPPAGPPVTGTSVLATGVPSLGSSVRWN